MFEILLNNIIPFVIILTVLVFVHELGHLLAAKWANVKVENFSIGFGPKLFKFNLGETEYSLSLLPLGGYVKMQGENINEISDNKKIDPKRSFDNLPIRVLPLLSAGSPANWETTTEFSPGILAKSSGFCRSQINSRVPRLSHLFISL